MVTNKTTFDPLEMKNDLWAYDPLQDSWSKKRSFKGAKRENGVVLSVSDKGYYGNGQGSVWLGTKFNFTDFWEYDPITNNWIKVANFPGSSTIGNIGFSSFGMGYVALGYDTRELWKYDPSLNIWVQRTSWPGLATSPLRTANLLNFAIRDRWYVVENDFDWSTGQPERDLWKYVGN